MNMIEQALAQGVFKLCLAVIAVMVSLALLRWMDRRLSKLQPGSFFSRWRENASSEALGVYYGARVIAVCLLVGMVIG